MLDVEKVTHLSERQKLELLKKVADGKTSEEECGRLCECLMRDLSASVRRLAIEGLWGISDTKYVEPLIATVSTDEDMNVRASAASVLGTFVCRGLEEETPPLSYHRVRDFLVDVIRNEKMPLLVRRSALEGASFDPDDRVAELIAWGYTHTDREVNLSAIFAMGRSQCDRWVPFLAREMQSSDHERRLEAINAAGEGYLQPLTPMLRNLAMSSDKEIAIAGIWSLAHTGGPGALEQLELCATSSDAEISRNASDAISEYRTVNARSRDDEETQE